MPFGFDQYPYPIDPQKILDDRFGYYRLGQYGIPQQQFPTTPFPGTPQAPQPQGPTTPPPLPPITVTPPQQNNNPYTGAGGGKAPGDNAQDRDPVNRAIDRLGGGFAPPTSGNIVKAIGNATSILGASGAGTLLPKTLLGKATGLPIGLQDFDNFVNVNTNPRLRDLLVESITKNNGAGGTYGALKDVLGSAGAARFVQRGGVSSAGQTLGGNKSGGRGFSAADVRAAADRANDQRGRDPGSGGRRGGGTGPK